MTSIKELNLTEKQTAALIAAGEYDEIENIDGAALSKIKDGRIRNGIGIKLEGWRKAQEPAPEPGTEPIQTEWIGKTFGDRLQAIRVARGYIRKVMKHGMDYTAVQFDDLLAQVRDLFLTHGISWHTEATQITESRAHHMGELLVLEDLIVFTFRFQCVEGPFEPDWFRDIQVPARSFDVFDPNSSNPQGDKGPGKAHTYGQKLALRTLLNLPAGDDPDFTPAASLGTRAKAMRDELVGRLGRAIAKSGSKDIELEIKTMLMGFNERYTRSVEAIEDVDDQTLMKWCRYYEEKAPKAPEK